MTLHKFGTLKLIGQIMCLNAIVHAIVPLLLGFSGFSLLFLMDAIIYGLAAWGLLRGKRWLAYLAFIIGCFSAVFAFACLGATTVPNALLWVIILVNAAVAIASFVHIWRRD